MSEEQHRHDISDHHWALLEPYLPGRKGRGAGRPRTIAALSTPSCGFFAPLPLGAICPRNTEAGSWKNVRRRFCRWRDRGVQEHLLQTFVNGPDFAWPMIDATHCKVHQHGTGVRGGSEGMALTKGGQHQSTLGSQYRWQAAQGHGHQRQRCRLLLRRTSYCRQRL